MPVITFKDQYFITKCNFAGKKFFNRQRFALALRIFFNKDFTLCLAGSTVEKLYACVFNENMERWNEPAMAETRERKMANVAKKVKTAVKAKKAKIVKSKNTKKKV